MNRIRGKLTYANVMVTVLAFVVLAGGTAFAATQMLPKNSVGTKQIKNAAVTPAKLSTAAKATLTGAAGPKGATGATGPKGSKGDKGDRGEKGEKGDAGASATALWAVVSASGLLKRGSDHAVKVEHPETGKYDVWFDRDISTCSYQATMGFAWAEVTAEFLLTNHDVVIVEVGNSAGSGYVDKEFDLAVFC